jgi:PST family polysaccharide transporter
MKTLRSDVIFSLHDGQCDLAHESVRGGLVTLTSQGVQFLLRTVGMVVLARLLTPSDFGLVAMVAVVVNFVQMFRDAGLSTVTIQRDRISPAQVSTLFWLNVLTSTILGLCILASAPLVSLFYGRPELTTLGAAMSVPVILGGLTIQHQAILRRHLRFGMLACIHMGSLFSSVTVTVLLAWAGWRVWALVAGMLAEALAGVILTFTVCPWLPGGMRRGTGARASLRFGGHLMGFSLANFLSRNGDNLLVGQCLGAESLGLYAKAYQVFMMPISQIRGPLDQVGLPVLSSLRGHPDRYLRYYQRLLDVVASLTLPVTVYCFLESSFLVEQLLGPRWLGAAPVLHILAVAGIIQPLFSTAGLVQLSYGFSRRYMSWGIVGAVCYVSAFLIGIRSGAEGVAMSYTAANYLLFVPTLAYCFRGTPVTLGFFARSVATPLGCTAAAAMIGVCVSHLGSPETRHIVFLLGYLGALFGVALLRKSFRGLIGSTVDICLSRLSRRSDVGRLSEGSAELAEPAK